MRNNIQRELREAMMLLKLFGHKIPKDFITFNDREIIEINDTIMELLAQYSENNKEFDVVATLMTLAEINMYINQIAVKHGALEIFYEIKNVMADYVANQYLRTDKGKRIVVRAPNGNILKLEDVKDSMQGIKKVEANREATLYEQVDEILVRHKLFFDKK